MCFLSRRQSPLKTRTSSLSLTLQAHACAAGKPLQAVWLVRCISHGQRPGLYAAQAELRLDGARQSEALGQRSWQATGLHQGHRHPGHRLDLQLAEWWRGYARAPLSKSARWHWKTLAGCRISRSRRLSRRVR